MFSLSRLWDEEKSVSPTGIELTHEKLMFHGRLMWNSRDFCQQRPEVIVLLSLQLCTATSLLVMACHHGL